MNSDDILLQAPPLPLIAEGGAEEAFEEGMAMRWRNAILRLSETFMDAADEHSDLSPVLLEAMHNALNNLLVYGEADDLMVLEEWLNMEDEGKKLAAAMRGELQESMTPRGPDRRGGERRLQALSTTVERRRESRRTGERREIKDWTFDAIPMGASPLDTPETVEG